MPKHRFCTDADPPFTPAQSLANAYERVASANHYMVGVIHPFDIALWQDAYQILVAAQNVLPPDRKIAFKRLDLAMDLMEHDFKEKTGASL